jgi:hypothetical protein
MVDKEFEIMTSIVDEGEVLLLATGTKGHPSITQGLPLLGLIINKMSIWLPHRYASAIVLFSLIYVKNLAINIVTAVCAHISLRPYYT